MEFKKRISNKCLALVLILCITKVCHGQLMCYVCDDCDKVSMQTPQFECNDDFFNTGGATSSSVQTTTEYSTTSAAVTTEKDTTAIDDTTQTPSTVNVEETTTTTTSKTESTTKESKVNVTETTTPKTAETTTLKEIETTLETTSTTEEQPPSPPTEGPPRSTTAVPTPPTPDSLVPLDDVENLNNRTGANDQHVNKDDVENIDMEQGTNKTYKPSAEIRVRQLRSVSDVSFHCFKVKATTANGTMIVNRGCSRIATNESVCGQWQAQHTLEQMNKCFPCSRTKCNGSSALSVSITTLFAAVIAFLVHRM